MRIDVPKEMAACVKAMKGVVLDEVLKAPDFTMLAHPLWPHANQQQRQACHQQVEAKQIG